MKLNRITKVAISLGLALAIERSCHSVTKGFSLMKIHSDLSYNPRWDTSPLSTSEQSKVLKILDQPFTFLGNGAQCYAFESQDHQYVIKFFKHHHMRVNSWINRLELSPMLHHYRLKLTGGGQERLDLIFGSCKISYEVFKEETGLIYIHLNKTNYLNRHLTIIDRLHIAHTIDLDQIEFVVQKKAEMLYPTLKKMRDSGDIEGVKHHLDSLLIFLSKRLKNGIADNDPAFHRNFGCIDSKTIEIDQSSFFFSPHLKKPYSQKQALYFETLSLKSWIRKHIPQVSDYLNEQIDQQSKKFST